MNPHLLVHLRLTLDCGHFILHGPCGRDLKIFIGEEALCLICPPLEGFEIKTAEGETAVSRSVYVTRQVVETKIIEPEDWHGDNGDSRWDGVR